MDAIDSKQFIDDPGAPKFHSVNTITLGELIDNEIFKWPDIWNPVHAYSPDQYERICNAFEARYYSREIGITPYKAWARRLSYELIYNLMPKYIPMYKQLEDGYDPLQNGGEYKKERKIESDFPETLLSANQDYASRGYDFESESIGRGNLAEDYALYVEKFHAIDDTIVGELEKLFSCLYTINVNGW